MPEQKYILFLLFFVLIPLAVLLIIRLKRIKNYEASSYYQNTEIPYSKMNNDPGKLGEYLAYYSLQSFEKQGAKFLFNVYLPKENEETTEIDLIMIHKKGIFVLESKNYAGWIFGSEEQKNWYQTLPTRRRRAHKEAFYNPVKQNDSHIKHLRPFLPKELPVWSIIVFSDRCTLKNVKVTRSDVRVTNCRYVSAVISAICNQNSSEILSEEELFSLYYSLYSYTNVSSNVKEHHIAHVLQAQSSSPVTLPMTQAAPSVESPAISAESLPSEQKERPANLNFCPYCGGKLVVRTAKRGKFSGNRFLGCSNYPKCSYIVNF